MEVWRAWVDRRPVEPPVARLPVWARLLPVLLAASTWAALSARATLSRVSSAAEASMAKAKPFTSTQNFAPKEPHKRGEVVPNMPKLTPKRGETKKIVRKSK